MKLTQRLRLRKKRLYRSVESALAKHSSPSTYLKLMPLLFKVFQPRADVNQYVTMTKRGESWYVADETDALCVASYRRFERYLCRGVQGTIRTLIERYLPSMDLHSVLTDRVVIDVGANIGEFSIAALQHGAGLCVSIEPDPKAAKSLRANVDAFGPRSLVCETLLDETENERQFFLATDMADSSFIQPTHHSEIAMLRSTTLDALIERHNIRDVHVLKVEAEGAEPEVLSGCMGILTRFSPIVTVDTGCERHGESTFDQCASILRKVNYQIERRRGGMHLLAYKNRN